MHRGGELRIPTAFSSGKIQVRGQQDSTVKGQEEENTEQNIIQKQRQNKDASKHAKADRIYYKQTCTTKKY